VPHGRRSLSPSCGGKRFQSRCRAVRTTNGSSHKWPLRAGLLLLLACHSVHPSVPFGGSGLESGMSVTASWSGADGQRTQKRWRGTDGQLRTTVWRPFVKPTVFVQYPRPTGQLYRQAGSTEHGKRQRRVAGTTWRAVLLLVRRADDFLERAGGGARSSANERFTGKENGMWRAGPWARRERRVIHVSQFGPWAERFRRYPKISVIPVCHWQWLFSFFKAHACDLLRFHGLSIFVVSCTECSWVALALGMYGSHGLQYQ
jgi:hypothetical protein